MVIKAGTDRLEGLAKRIGCNNFLHGGDLNKDAWMFCTDSIKVTTSSGLTSR